MSHRAVLSENQTTAQDALGIDSDDALRCPLSDRPLGLDNLTSDLCNVLEEAGCPLAPPVQERLRFETFLRELSATFVNLSAGQVDSQIDLALQRLVVFLGIDRGSLAELPHLGIQLVFQQ